MDISYIMDWKRLEVSKSWLPCLPDKNFRRISRFYQGTKWQSSHYFAAFYLNHTLVAMQKPVPASFNYEVKLIVLFALLFGA